MRSEIILTFLGMGLVTYLTRSLFIIGIRDESLPPFIVRWLRFVPVAVLAAIICPMIAAPQGKLFLTYDNPYLLSGVLTSVLAFVTKNLIVTVIGGIGIIILLKYLMG
jgi:branched-subunit amino acid transport protein